MEKKKKKTFLNIVLVEPEIPPNTGNIARTCVAIGAHLHLVKPLGFSLDNKYLKRAGLDYWEDLTLTVHSNLDEFISYVKKEEGRLVLATKKDGKIYSDFEYKKDDYLVFGSETKGLREDFLKLYQNTLITIPMLEETKIRSLNLSNSVAIIAYEALRQTTENFLNFSTKKFGLS